MEATKCRLLSYWWLTPQNSLLPSACLYDLPSWAVVRIREVANQSQKRSELCPSCLQARYAKVKSGRAATLNTKEQLPKFGWVYVSFRHADRTLPLGKDPRVHSCPKPRSSDSGLRTPGLVSSSVTVFVCPCVAADLWGDRKRQMAWRMNGCDFQCSC